MSNFFKKTIIRGLIGLGIVLLVRTGCTVKPDVTSGSENNPSSFETAALGCLESLPSVPVRKDESSKDVEAEADKLEEQGKGQEALDMYSEARLLYFRELGYATGKAMKGDTRATWEINISIISPEFPFKVGRAFAKTGKHKIAIDCFTESLDKKIDPPNDASAYLNRGEAYLTLGQKEKARQDYQKSAGLFRKYKLPHYEKMANEKLRSLTP